MSNNYNYNNDYYQNQPYQNRSRGRGRGRRDRGRRANNQNPHNQAQLQYVDPNYTNNFGCIVIKLFVLPTNTNKTIVETL